MPPYLQCHWSHALYCPRCDEIDLQTQEIRDLSVPRATYAHAQKMRAAMSHKFGRDLGLGTMPWTENPVKPGKFVGNPSLSPQVSQYMVSLQRRKVRTQVLYPGHIAASSHMRICRSELVNKPQVLVPWIKRPYSIFTTSTLLSKKMRAPILGSVKCNDRRIGEDARSG
jgi:hypothetical protein